MRASTPAHFPCPILSPGSLRKGGIARIPPARNPFRQPFPAFREKCRLTAYGRSRAVKGIRIIYIRGRKMFPKYAFFNLGAILVLWGLTILGVLACLPCWTATAAEYEEGLRTLGGRRLVLARTCLTAGCVAVWCCTFLGSVVKGPKSPDLDFGFWQDFPVVLQALFFPIDAALVASVFFAYGARGRGRMVLLVATQIMAVAAFAGSVILWQP